MPAALWINLAGAGVLALAPVAAPAAQAAQAAHSAGAHHNPGDMACSGGQGHLNLSLGLTGVPMQQNITGNGNVGHCSSLVAPGVTSASFKLVAKGTGTCGTGLLSLVGGLLGALLGSKGGMTADYTMRVVWIDGKTSTVTGTLRNDDGSIGDSNGLVTEGQYKGDSVTWSGTPMGGLGRALQCLLGNPITDEDFEIGQMQFS